MNSQYETEYNELKAQAQALHESITAKETATMNVVRQYLAVSVLLFAFDFLVEGKYFRYALSIAVAMLFHTSALVVAPFFVCFLLYKKLNKKIVFRILMIVYVISLIAIFVDMRDVFQNLSFIVPDRYDSYWTSKFFNERNWFAALKLIVPNLIFLFCAKYRKNLEKNDKRFDALFIAWFFYVVISNAFYGINVFIRLGWYFDFYVLALIPIIIDYIDSKKKVLRFGRLRLKVSSLVMIVLVSYYISLDVYGIFIKGGHGVVPYKTFWMK